MNIAKAPRVVLILAVLGISVAYLLLNFELINGDVSIGQYQLGSLPQTVRFRGSFSFTKVLLFVVPGSLALATQFIAFTVACLRDRRRWSLDNSLFVVAFALWSITVGLTFLLGAGRYNSIQGWQVFPDESILLHLTEILVAGALPDASAILRAMISAMFLVVSSTSLGLAMIWALERLFKSQRNVGAICLVTTAFLLGQGILSGVFVFLSIFKSLSYPVLSICLLFGLAIGLSRLLVVGREALGEVTSGLYQLRSETRFWKGLIALTLILIGTTVLQAWARLSFDAASAYFAGAKLTAFSSELVYTSRSYLAVSGSNAETTMAAMITLFGDRSARLISWFEALAFAIFCGAIAGQIGASRRGKVIVVIMVYTTTAFLDLIGDGKTDLFGAAVAMAAVWWLLNSKGANQRLALSICGLLSGFALLYRPTYVLPLLILILIAIPLHHAGSLQPTALRLSARPILTSYLLVGVLAALPVISYVGRNLMLFGTPLVPALPAVADARLDPASGIADLSGWHSGIRTFVRLTFPAFATFVSTPQSLGVLTPLFLAFAPLALVVASTQRETFADQTSAAAKWLAPLGTVLLIFWILLTPFVLEIRYVLMLWGLVFAFVGYAVEKSIAVGSRSVNLIVVWLLVVVLVWMIVRTIYGVGVTTDEPLEGGAPTCGSTVQCNMLNRISQDADPGDRVLVAASFAYYLRPDLFACASTAEELATLRSSLTESSESFWAAVHDLGFNYIAYEPIYATIFSPLGSEVDVDAPPAWVTLTSIYSDEDRSAFYVEMNDPSLPPPASRCQQVENGKWVIQNKGS